MWKYQESRKWHWVYTFNNDIDIRLMTALHYLCKTNSLHSVICTKWLYHTTSTPQQLHICIIIYWAHAWTLCGPLRSYGDLDRCQNWLRLWFIGCQHQVIVWRNFLLLRFCDIHMRSAVELISDEYYKVHFFLTLRCCLSTCSLYSRSQGVVLIVMNYIYHSVDICTE